jgi:hypothetical protein
MVSDMMEPINKKISANMYLVMITATVTNINKNYIIHQRNYQI